MERICMSVSSWFSMLLCTVPLALMLLRVLPSGVPLQIAAHVILLVVGAAIVMALQPDELE
ncbi:MAG TPA: hypothetical protein VLB44_02880 [Kofleriaceae bacterium]|nr:hypothetical protein [Kofleriaceae bacterium]